MDSIDLGSPEKPEATWTTRTGKVIPVRELESQHLINLLRLLQRHAELKRRAIVELYFDLPQNWSSLQGHFDAMHDQVMEQTWRDWVDEAFLDLELEAAARKLSWDLFEGGPILEIDTTNRAGLRRAIAGAIKDSIAAHGPITGKNTESLVKRIIGQIHTYNHGIKRTA